MEMKEPLIEELNKLTDNKYNFNLKSATLDEGADFCVIEIFYKDGELIDKATKEKLNSFIVNFLPSKFKYDVTFIKNFISEERIEKCISDFLKNDFSSLEFNISGVENKSGVFFIKLVIDNLSYEYALKRNIKEKIIEELKKVSDECEYNIEITNDDVYTTDEKQELIDSYKEEEIDASQFRKIDFYDTEVFVNEEVLAPASYVVDKKNPEENVVFCGKIKFIKTVIIKRKPKENPEAVTDENGNDNSNDEVGLLENSEENLKPNESVSNDKPEDKNDSAPKYERKLFKWVLEDITGTMPCVFMSNKENQTKLESLKDGDVIAVHGKTEIDSFSGDVVMRVKDISLCKIPEGIKEYIVYKKEKPFYEFIEPQPMVMYEQDTLLSYNIEKTVPKFLQGKTFVCYDLETTGLHFARGDRMVEIGAIKIVDGKITEKFGTYVNPNGKKIDPKASETTGIYDEDVADAPMDYEVLQDFYKFTRNAILIGYNNINFDNVFLFGQAKECRWNFDNETEDVFKYAQKYVTGVKNYKLGTIAEKLGVTLDNAHSAIYDALATAEIFIKIAELIVE